MTVHRTAPATTAGTVHLNITAEQAPGNLLCAIAGLLDNRGGPTGGLAAILHRILGILG